MKKRITTTIVIVFGLFTSLANAQTLTPPGGIVLNQTFTDTKGKPVLNEADRSLNLVVVEPIHEDDLNYEKGAVVTDDTKKQEVLAYEEKHNLQHGVTIEDPKCDKCKPLTLDIVLERAVLVRLCQAPGTRVEKSAFCTADEEKAENGADSARVILGRQRFEAEIEAAAKEGKSLVLDEQHRDLLKKLVAGAFMNQPLIAAQALMMIDPSVQPVEFGKAP